MTNMVKYRNEWLARGSDAYRLWEEKRYAELDKHLKQLAKNAEELPQRYRQAPAE